MNILKIIFYSLFAQFVFAADVPQGLALNEECQQFIEKIKDKYEYGWVQSQSESNLNLNVSIFYYFLKTNLVNGKIKNPIIFFNGGPGYSSHGQGDFIQEAYVKHQIKTELNFIYMDQRGTGCSTPFPVGIDRNTLEKLKYFGSSAIVEDAELIRKKIIGDRPWKVFGQSYGAFVVYRYISLFPSSIQKAYAHGNAIQITDQERTYNRILSQHNVLEAYFKKYPDDRKRLFILKLGLSDKSKCLKNNFYEYCGYEMLMPLLDYLGFKDIWWPSLHAWIITIVPMNSISEAGLQNYVNQFIKANTYYYREISAPDMNSNISLNFLGLFDWNTTPLTADKCTAVHEKMQSQLKMNKDDILLDQCMAAIQFDYKDKIELEIHNQMPDFKAVYLSAENVLAQVKKHKIQLFTYSGSLDCYVPKESFVNQNKIFGPNVSYINFPNTGHDGYFVERQVFVDLTK